jgi:hypothetical protein
MGKAWMICITPTSTRKMEKATTIRSLAGDSWAAIQAPILLNALFMGHLLPAADPPNPVLAPL